jgi:hypothetical protein
MNAKNSIIIGLLLNDDLSDTMKSYPQYKKNGNVEYRTTFFTNVFLNSVWKKYAKKKYSNNT